MDNIKYTFNKILENFLKVGLSDIHIESENTIILYNNNLELKLNYVQILVLNDNEIIWSDENEFNDIRTKEITKIIRSKLNKTNNKKRIKEELSNFIKKNNLLKIDNNNLNILGLLTVPQKLDNSYYKQYYLITDIININM